MLKSFKTGIDENFTVQTYEISNIITSEKNLPAYIFIILHAWSQLTLVYLKKKILKMSVVIYFTLICYGYNNIFWEKKLLTPYFSRERLLYNMWIYIFFFKNCAAYSSPTSNPTISFPISKKIRNSLTPIEKQFLFKSLANLATGPELEKPFFGCHNVV
jgi:hypothetical protein